MTQREIERHYEQDVTELGEDAWYCLALENGPRQEVVGISQDRPLLPLYGEIRGDQVYFSLQTPSVWCEECGFHGPVDQHKEDCR